MKNKSEAICIDRDEKVLTVDIFDILLEWVNNEDRMTIHRSEFVKVAKAIAKKMFYNSISKDVKPIEPISDAVEFGKYLHTNYAPIHSLKWIKRNIGGDSYYTKEVYEKFKSEKSQITSK